MYRNRHSSSSSSSSDEYCRTPFGVNYDRRITAEGT